MLCILWSNYGEWGAWWSLDRVVRDGFLEETAQELEYGKIKVMEKSRRKQDTTETGH